MTTTDVLLGDGGIAHRTTSTMKRHLSLLYVDVLKRMDNLVQGLLTSNAKGPHTPAAIWDSASLREWTMLRDGSRAEGRPGSLSLTQR